MSPAISWEVSLGGTQNEDANVLVQTHDGGYVVAGTTSSNNGQVSGNHGNLDFWITKINSFGNLEWQKTFGGPFSEIPYDIKKTNDGGYIIVGSTTSVGGNVSSYYGGQYDAWVIKISSTGNLQWQKSFGGTGSDIAHSIELTDDGGYIIAAETTSNDFNVIGNHGSIDFWVFKISANGSMIWSRTYGSPASEQAKVIRRTNDGGYIVGGTAIGPGNSGDITTPLIGMNDFWVVKINANGSIIWQKIFGGTANDFLEDLITTQDGGYAIIGRHQDDDGMGMATGSNGLWDAWVIKTNSLGIIEWQRCHGDIYNEKGNAIYQTSDGGFVFCGEAEMSANGQTNFFVKKLNINGNTIWAKTLGGNLGESAKSIIQTSDSGFAIAGTSNSINNGDVSGGFGSNDFWIVKLHCDLLPVNPISGNSDVCRNTQYTFSTLPVNGAVQYDWVVPQDAVIISGQGTTSIQVGFNSLFNFGNISVTPKNSCGIGNTTVFPVVYTPINGVILGSSSVCLGNVQTYSFDLINGVTSYQWTIPTNATIVSGQGTNSIQVIFTSLLPNSSISVTPQNSCGSGITFTKNILTTSTLTPTYIHNSKYQNPVISGIIRPCLNEVVHYSLTNTSYISGATDFIWSVPPQAQIVYGQGTANVGIRFNSLANSGFISVIPTNGCGSASTRQLQVYPIQCIPNNDIKRQSIDVEVEIDLVFYPNPVKSTLFLENLKINDEIRIFDFTGKEVIVYINSKNDEKYNLDLQQLAKGVYLIKHTRNNAISKNFKFIKD